MLCALVSPPVFETANGKRVHPKHYPYMLAYVGALLEKSGIGVLILDGYHHNYSLQQVCGILKEKKPAVIAIAPFEHLRETPIDISLKLAGKIKKIMPDVPVGLLEIYFIKYFDKLVEQNDFLDFAVIGDAEQPMLELCQRVENGLDFSQVRGVAYRKNGVFIRNKERPPLENLDELPFPAWHHVPLMDYMFYPHRARFFPCLPVLASRGCPYSCQFCHVTSWAKYRLRRVGNVIEECVYLKEKYGAKEIQFSDPTFGYQREWLNHFCEQYIKSEINLPWSCLTRVDVVDPEALKMMKHAGCWNIFFGIESASEDIANFSQKNISLQRARDAIRWTKEAGIECTASFMIGLPHEKPGDIYKTMDFAIDLDPDYAQFFINRSFYFEDNRWLKFGKVSERWDFAPFEFSGNIFVPEAYTGEEHLKKIQQEAYRKFYFRPSYMLKRLQKIRSWEDIARHLFGVRILFQMQ